MNASSPMQLIRLLWRDHPWVTVFTTLSGLISGIASIAMVQVVNTAIHDQSLDRSHLLTFVVATLFAVLAKNVASLLPSYAASKISASLRIALCNRILGTDLESIDRRGTPQIMTLLTKDIPQITLALLMLPTVYVQAAVFLCGIAYLAYLSWLIFALTTVSIGIAVMCYLVFFARAMKFSNKVRDEFTVFNEYTHGLLLGIKELKLNRSRRRWFQRAAIGLSSRRMARYRLIEVLWQQGGENIAQMAFSVLLALLVFAAPSFQAFDAATLTAAVLVVMYVIGPLTVVIDMLPIVTDGGIACSRVEQFGLSLQDDTLVVRRSAAWNSVRSKGWRSIELRDVTASAYASEDSKGFELGPINFSFVPGELIFITGGNGSGKSTFAKIVTGLYRPNSGQILLDGEAIEDEGRERHRSLFTAIFSEFHVFKRSIGEGPGEFVDGVSSQQRYLERLGLQKHVSLEGKNYSTTHALSYGQRKRLALLNAYIEDRPIYLLDEWAADQDPQFRQFFYDTLLPDMKQLGKTVLVITHDEHYFDRADRVIQLREGKIVSDERLTMAI